MIRYGWLLLSLIVLAAPAVAIAQAPPSRAEMQARGEAVYKARCASCHDRAQDRTPDKGQLASRWGDEIVKALTHGPMAPMAVGLSSEDIRAVAQYLSGWPPGSPMPAQIDPPACTSSPAFRMTQSDWSGWSPDHRNYRYQAQPGFRAADIPRMKVKWAMSYIGARYGPPTVVGGRLFVASSTGIVYALDPKTGCRHWRFDAPAGVRTAVNVGRAKASPSGYAAYFGDYQRNVYAVDAVSGKLIWKANVEAHPKAVLSGTPVLHEGRIYVPVSSWEEVMGAAVAYSCCSFRGSLATLDAETGKLVWKTYVIEQEPKPYRKNAAGTPMLGPAGAAIWSAPTIDPKRGQIYVATGDSYTDVPETSSDAVIALDLATGRIRWKNQVTPGDNYLMGCSREPKAINCPHNVGTDVDFGASPIIMPLGGGRDILLAGQKSGVAFGFDPDTGKKLWQTRVGQGGALGGIEWGFATDGKTAYVTNADPFESPKVRRGLAALDPATGRELWFTRTPQAPCGWTAGTRCVSANSAAPTLVPGAVISTSIDGRIRAYDPATGRITWTFDTAGQKYQTINGVKDQGGGALDQASPTVADGMMFVMSGYTANMGGVPNNVLLAFSVDGK
ncbi:PQQ-binding-like beta-propeller repeat protein [Phenylobacterium sp.]|jgi:polyvinyl alcohol dehydrogenase (cytochrome)|uniref:outer membrane protein assembly factor BamB family protein n=1 Tax=Phenylobacterium sp. TaxID=1871053 RepID=UPI002F94B2BB